MWPLTVEGAEIFGLLLIRCMGFYIAGPIFAQRGIPAQVKLLLGVATAVALFPVASGTGVPFILISKTRLELIVCARIASG